MLKTKKSKQNVTILVLSVMLAIAAIFGVTAAWFVSTAGASGTVSTGEVQVALMIGGSSGTSITTAATANATTLDASNLAAGDTIIKEVGFKMLKNIAERKDGKNGVYVRITFAVAGEDNTKLTIVPQYDASAWYKDGEKDVYYYGTGTNALTAVTSLEYVKFCDAVSLAATSNDQGKTATITVTVEVVQVANQGGTIAWNND